MKVGIEDGAISICPNRDLSLMTIYATLQGSYIELSVTWLKSGLLRLRMERTEQPYAAYYLLYKICNAIIEANVSTHTSLVNAQDALNSLTITAADTSLVTAQAIPTSLTDTALL